ncbi:HP1 family phage holin [Vibrio splendidus]|uniref:HP1 family phage holin n=1 Tax=Vibrio splendidus TaxID=29497 RepID=UPI000C863089|nr:HP1 family phage holin [Vibrio splendidus]PMI49557.1 hypothetical protein BCU42_14270 [Vibrio splendidus]
MQDKLSSFVSYVSSFAYAGFGALTLQDWVSVIGLLFVIITYFTNRYYNKKTLELMKANPNKAVAIYAKRDI